MTYQVGSSVNEAMALLQRMLDELLAVVPGPKQGDASSTARRLVGDLRSRLDISIRMRTIGDDLLACFEAAREAGATIDGFETVRESIMVENPISEFAIASAAAGLVYCVAEESKIVAAITFVSRIEVDAMMVRIRPVFEEAKIKAANYLDSASYALLVTLSASVMQHLASTERQLPRVVTYTMGLRLPALMLANYIYGDASRYEELIAENKVVHPLFCPRTITALSE